MISTFRPDEIIRDFIKWELPKGAIVSWSFDNGKLTLWVREGSGVNTRPLDMEGILVEKRVATSDYPSPN